MTKNNIAQSLVAKRKRNKQSWHYCSPRQKSMKKLVYSSKTTPMFNFKQGQVQKLSQNINIHFNNTDTLSCNNLANFDSKYPADNTNQNPPLIENHGFVHHDSKPKNNMDQNKKSCPNIDYPFCD